VTLPKSQKSLLSLKSWLFTPATKSDRFARAGDAHADVLIIDLEDSVAPSAKKEARETALRYLAAISADHMPLALRVNSTDTMTVRLGRGRRKFALCRRPGARSARHHRFRDVGIATTRPWTQIKRRPDSKCPAGMCRADHRGALGSTSDCMENGQQAPVLACCHRSGTMETGR